MRCRLTTLERLCERLDVAVPKINKEGASAQADEPYDIRNLAPQQPFDQTQY
jgi:hypothetical protein